MANGIILTNKGKLIVLNRTFKATPDYATPTLYKVGIGTTTPVIADTDLGNPIPHDSTELVDACDVTTGWVDSADMTLSVNSTTYKENLLALNLTKDGTGAALASTTKPTTSLDFTSKDLTIWIYVADATVYAQLATTDCLTIRFGSDASNYYQWTKDKADLAVGWNAVGKFNTDNEDSTTGSPAITACDYSYIGVTATGASETWVAGKIIMDEWKLANATDYTSTYEAGYPSIDETAFTVTTRTLLTTTQANGYPLTEFGMFNADATAKMFSRIVHTAITKTSSVQVIYIEKDEIA